MRKHIAEQTLRRIPLYHQILSDLEKRGEPYVSSKYLATFMRVDDTQVRKDVSIIGYRGKPKSGYSVTGLKLAIGEYLGINYENTAILIGAGKLGSALVEYPGFAEYGMKIIEVFDIDPERIGEVVGNFTVLSTDALPAIVNSADIGIAIITVPKAAAQEVCDNIVALSIKAVWNFAPARLTVPGDVTVRNENLAIGIALLSHSLKLQKA